MHKNRLVITPSSFFVDGPVSDRRISEVIASWADDHQIGGIASFAGHVRADEIDGASVTRIEFTAYAEPAENAIRSVIERVAAAENGSIRRVHVEHALGSVATGEAPLIIVVGSERRAAAFRACSAILEGLKQEAPIYGKEITEETHRWKKNS